IDLRVGLAVFAVPALADDLPVTHHDRADQRVRLDVAAAALGQLQRPLHPGSFRVAHAESLPDRANPAGQTALVPKLCLGTPLREQPSFPNSVWERQSANSPRSQTLFGNASPRNSCFAKP